MEILAVQLAPDTPNERPELYQKVPKKHPSRSKMNMEGHSLQRTAKKSTYTCLIFLN